MSDFNVDSSVKRRPPNRRTFTIEPVSKLEKNLKFFMQQELAYYNILVENFNARIRAFPQDVVAIRDRDIKLLETCGQFAYDPRRLLNSPHDTWPEVFKTYNQILFDKDNQSRIDSKQLAIMQIGTVNAHIHHQVRRNIISELFSTVSNQAAIFLAGKNTEQLRAPVHMLQTQTWETKHHLQIPKSIVEMNYNNDTNLTKIVTPYNKEPLTVLGYDLTAIPYTLLIVRAPIVGEEKPTWRIDFKDVTNKYLLTLTDPKPYKKKHRQ